MSGKLPINIDDLLRQRTVEGDRIEYKAGWNPDATIRTLCAFANDFENLGGGYVVIGQDAVDGQVHDEAHDEAHDGAHDAAHDEPLSEAARQVLVILATGPQSRSELTGVLGIKSNRAGHFLRAVEQLRRKDLMELTIPDKPQSKNQKMRITPNGLTWLAASEAKDV